MNTDGMKVYLVEMRMVRDGKRVPFPIEALHTYAESAEAAEAMPHQVVANVLPTGAMSQLGMKLKTKARIVTNPSPEAIRAALTYIAPRNVKRDDDLRTLAEALITPAGYIPVAPGPGEAGRA